MYPNLSYLLHDLIGTSRDNALSVIQMFGLMMACGFFALAYILYIELKRKEKEGLLHASSVNEWVGKGAKISDIVSNTIFGFIVGFKLPEIIGHFAEFTNDAAGFVFSVRGNWGIGIIGLLLFGGYTYWQGQKKKLAEPKLITKMVQPHERVGDIIILAAIFGLIGARLFSILENMDSFWRDPLGQLFSGSGLTIYGGFILATLMIFRYVRRHGMPPIHVMDAIAPALILGYGIGRLGCQISGDGDWGIVNELAKPSWFFLPDWMWAFDYPHNVLNEGVSLNNCNDRHCMHLVPSVFPTPIYEVISSVIIFGVLWYLRKRLKVAGQLFFYYLLLMSAARFAVEHIRVNPRYSMLGIELSQAQLISMALFVIGVIGIIYLKKNPDKKGFLYRTTDVS